MLKRPEKDDAGFVNGCLPQTEKSFELQQSLKASAVSINQIYECGEMPVIQWDPDIERWLKLSQNVIADINKEKPGSLLPHNIKASMYSGQTLYFSQGGIGSCCGHAFGFAYNSSLLINIALQGKQEYNAVNPIGTYVLSHGGRMRNGQTVSTMAKFCNAEGNYLVRDIGEGNQSVPRFTSEAQANALKNQSALMFLNNLDNVLKCLQGGVAVAFGQDLAVSGSEMKDDMPMAVFRGSWAHATHFAAWLNKSGTDYYYWVNSHGKRYKTGSLGETGDGCWMTEAMLRKFLSSRSYGDWVAVFAEGKK